MMSDIEKKDQPVEPSDDLSLKDWASFTPGQPLKEVLDPDEEDDDEDDDEQGGGSGDGKQPKGLKNYRVRLAQVLRFEKEASEEEKTRICLEKASFVGDCSVQPFSPWGVWNGHRNGSWQKIVHGGDWNSKS
jgi:hypothetical protein